MLRASGTDQSRRMESSSRCVFNKQKEFHHLIMWKILIKGFYICLKSLESIRETYIENQANKQKKSRDYKLQEKEQENYYKKCNRDFSTWLIVASD